MSNATFTWNGKSHSLLSETTAMACHSFALLAGSSCPGAVANSERDICTGCYAQIGMYAQNSVEAAQAARFAWTMWMIANDPAAWVDIMVHAIKATGEKYFRWHDSGDIFSPAYCRAIVQVCRRTPKVRHWLPTRSWHLPWASELQKLNKLRNVVVRPSALQWDAPAPKIKGLAKGTTACRAPSTMPEQHTMCPKTLAGHDASCSKVGCRDCWDKCAGQKAYWIHGYFGKHIVSVTTEAMKTKRQAACRKAMSFVPLAALAT